MKSNTFVFQTVQNFLEITLKGGKVIAGNIQYVDDEILILNNWKSPLNAEIDHSYATIDMNEIAMVKEYGGGIAGAMSYVECHERAGG